MTLEEIKAELKEMVPEFSERVAPVYTLLEWKWSPGETMPHIPSVDEIERTLYDLIEGLTEEYLIHGTGGLEAYYNHPDEQEPGCYGLAFTLEHEKSFD